MSIRFEQSDWRQIDGRIEPVTDEIETLAKSDDSCRRVMTVPGIGPIISSAMVAAIGSGAAFAKGRDFFRLGSVSSLSRYRPETEPSSDANGPDTERQDQLSPNHHFRLATRGRSIQQEETSAPTDMPSPLAFSAHHFLATAWEASIGSDEWKSRQLSVLSSTWSSRRQRDRLVLPC
jgi:hypothetical protein